MSTAMDRGTKCWARGPGPIDLVGAATSGLCALHCASMPLLSPLLPALGLSWLAAEGTETAMLGASVALATSGIGIGYLRHRSGLVVAGGATGLGLLAAGHLAEERGFETPGVAAVVAGGLAIAATHWLNRRLCRPCPGCREASVDKPAHPRPRESRDRPPSSRMEAVRPGREPSARVDPDESMTDNQEGENIDRRELLGTLGLGALGLAALPGREALALADDPHPHHHDPAHGEFLKACLLTSQVCNETFHYSFGHLKDGHKEHSRVAELTADCQAFAGLAAAMLARESDMLGHACLACAEVCKACVEECKKHDDKQLKECLDAFAACEKSCRAMAAHGADHKHHAG